MARTLQHPRQVTAAAPPPAIPTIPAPSRRSARRSDSRVDKEEKQQADQPRDSGHDEGKEEVEEDEEKKDEREDGEEADSAASTPRRSSRKPVPRKQLAEDEEEEEHDEDSKVMGKRRAARKATSKGNGKQAKGKKGQRIKKETEEEEEDEEKEDEHEEEEQDEGEEEGGEDDKEEAGSSGKKKRKTGKAVAVKVKEEDEEEAGEEEEHEEEEEGKKKRKRPATPRTPKRKGKAHLTPLTGDQLTAVRAVADSQSSTSATLSTRCCPRCSSREATRAVSLNNLSLLSSVLSSADVVADPLLPVSNSADDALILAIKQGKVACARLLWQHMQEKVALMRKHRGHYTKSKGWEEEEEEGEGEEDEQGGANGDDINDDGDDDDDDLPLPAATPSTTTSPTKAKPDDDNKDVLPTSRIALPTSTLATLDTGKSNYHAYGHATRKLNASRGGKEGNNAFVHDPTTDTMPDQNMHNAVNVAFQYGSVEMLQMMMQTRHGHDENYFKPTLPKGAAYVTCHAFILERIRVRGVWIAAEAGNVKLVKFMLSLLLGQGDTSAGFNKLHELVCDPKATLPPFRAPSATKKAAENEAITPVHLACISPDTAHLKKLIDVAGPQVLQAEDRQHRKPVHFAAVSSTPDALKLLLKYGVSLVDRDKSLKTPLDYAVETGRAHNIPLLIPQPHKAAEESGDKEEGKKGKKGGKATKGKAKKKKGNEDEDEEEKNEGDGQQLTALMDETNDDDAASSRHLTKKQKKEQEEAKKLNSLMNDPRAFLNNKDKKTGNTLLHTATKAGHAAAVVALCNAGADPTLADKEKLTPLILACQRGSKECVEALIEAARSQAQRGGADEDAAEGALLLHKDRTGKLGAHYAVMNGHFALVRLLLEKGVDVNSADSSDNTLLHYAAAYGQASVAELLMAAGAERNSLNMWKLSPLFISMLKSHLLCAELLLTGGHVDVNQRDSEGRTLLMHAVSSKTDSIEGCMKQVDFLLRQRIQADVHTAETSKQRTVLHIFAALPHANAEQDEALLKRLLDAGASADINRQDSDGYTPLALAVQAGNAPVVDMLLRHGADKGLLLSESNKSCLMLALELTPPALPTSQVLPHHHYWHQHHMPDQHKERRAFNKAIKQRRDFMNARCRILTAIVGDGAYQKMGKQGKEEVKGTGRKGKKAAVQEKDSAMDTTADGATDEQQSLWVSAIDSKGENALFYAVRSVVPLEDTLLLLTSPSTKKQLDVNILPHPEKGGGSVLARVLCQQPKTTAVVRPDYREPTTDVEREIDRLSEPTSHLYRHVQLVHTLISHGADVDVEWRSELPETDDAKVLKEAKEKQETRTLLMLALQAQPQQLVLPLFTLLCKAKAPLDGLAMPGSRSMLHMLLAKGKEMDLSPFLELIKQRANNDAADQLVLKDEAALPDNKGLTPTLTFWKAALPLPASASQPKSPSKSPKKNDDKSQLPVCQYGARCYRKNPTHFAQFSHPHIDRGDGDEDDGDEGNEGGGDEEEEDEDAGSGNGIQLSSTPVLASAAPMRIASARPRMMLASKPASRLPPSALSNFAILPNSNFSFPISFASPSIPASHAGTAGVSSGEKVSKWMDVDDSSAPVDVQAATSLLPTTTPTTAFVLSAARFFSQLEVWQSLVGPHIADTVQKSDEAKKEDEKKQKEQKKRDKQRGHTDKHDDADHPQAELDKLYYKLQQPPLQRELECTALHLAVLAGDVQAVQWLVRHGADVLAGEWFERTPLLLSVKDSSRVDIPQALLVERAAEQLSAVDALGVTPLMAAVSYSASHSSDSTREFVESFAVESLLMKHTRELNRTDRLGRNVVHYVFCPLHEEHTSGAVGDPIELLADLVAAASNPSNAAASQSTSLSSSTSALSLDVPDVYKRTPLHYCSEIGAQICLKYLVARGADPKRIDADGNGAFQLALLHDHRGYCVDLVDKGVDIARPIVQMPRKRKHDHQPTPIPVPHPTQPLQFGILQQRQLQQQQLSQQATTADANHSTSEAGKRLATFEYVLRKNWSGLAYLMMDAGIPLTVAVRDALATDRFQLVVTLIKKAGGDQIHTVDAETGRNVLHAVADYRPSSHDCAHHFNSAWSANIYQALQQLGLNVTKAAAAKTKRGELPLHFAAAHDHLQLMEALLTAYPAGLNALDGSHKTPLHYAVEGGHLKAVHLLCKKGAKLDWSTATIPAASSKLSTDNGPTSGRSEESLLDDKYSFPPLVGAARRCHYLVVELLLLFGADPNVTDNRGRTILMRAVSLNDSRLARLALHSPHPHHPDTKPSQAKKLAPSKPKLKPCNVNLQDSEGGSTALHLLVVPNGQYEPSYENAALLNEVVQLAQQKLASGEQNVKCKWDVQNKLGHTAAYYAAQQSSGVMLKALTDLKVNVPAAVLNKAKSDRAQWDKQHVPDSFAYDDNSQLDVDKDAAALKQWIAAKQQLEATKDDDSDTVPVDEEKFAKTYTVLMDDSDPNNPQPFDVMMTFTDTSGRHNRFGAHSFYKMQILYNQPQDLYLLWNRWGRVGTHGEYQQTPQANRETAIKQFKSIFKSKTANSWEQRGPDLFAVKPGKYVIDRSKVSGKSKVAGGQQSEDGEASIVSLQSLMAEHGKQLPPSTLPAPLQTLIAAICDLSSIQALAKRLGVETTKTSPLGELTDEQVQQGKAILTQLSDKVEEYTQAQSELGQVQLKLNEVQGKESQLSMEHMQQQAADGDMKDDEKAEQKEPSEEIKKLQAEREELQADLQRRMEARNALDGELTSLSNSYYTVVPSSQYVHSAISAIRTKEQLRKEQYNLSQMIDLHIATKILMGARASVIRLLSDSNPASSSSSPSSSAAATALAQINRALSDLSSTTRLNPIDYCYHALRVDLRLLDHSSSEFKRLRNYMHASTPDSGSSQQWELYDIVTVRRQGEEQRFQQFSKDIPNHQLLWHGSGMGNFTGLLTQGLRIAPPEALPSGYMFGKGIYCADQFQKSIAYCHDANLFNNNAYQRYRQQEEQSKKRSYCILLVEVALGNVYKAYNSEYMDDAKPGHHSTLGVGRRQPDRSQQLVTTEGVVIPSGPLVDTELEGRQAVLENNEFIVYKEEQACLRYVLRVGPPRPKRSAREIEKERTEVQWRENEEDEDGNEEEEAKEDDGAADGGNKPDAAEAENVQDGEEEMGEDDGSDGMEED